MRDDLQKDGLAASDHGRKLHYAINFAPAQEGFQSVTPAKAGVQSTQRKTGFPPEFIRLVRAGMTEESVSDFLRADELK